MRKSAAITITLLLIFSAVVLLPHGVRGAEEVYPGHPWSESWVQIKFVQNDAYEAGILHKNYEYLAAAWSGVRNQRVTVYVHVDLPISFLPSAGNFAARIVQKGSWVNKSVADKTDAQTGWIKPYTTSTGGNGARNWIDMYFTFLTNSTSYRPGIFQVQLRADVPVNFGTSYVTKTIAKMDGIFTYGGVDVKGIHDGTISNYTSINFQVGDGKYRVSFWYVGNGSEQYAVTRGTVSGEDVKELKVWNQTFTKDSGSITLTYYFSADDPTGIYIWKIDSINEDGTAVLYSWTPTVHNNAATLANDTPPTVSISLGKDVQVNGIMTITIFATSADSQAVTVWIIAYYSTNEYQIPDSATPLVQIFMKPYIVSSGSNVTIQVEMKWGGGFGVTAIARDDKGAMNITRAWVNVKDFEGSGGGGSGSTQQSWIIPPWDSVMNMVILLVGVIMMFSGKRELQVLGVLLFFASFVNWGYVAQYIQNALNPAHWFHLDVGVKT